MEETGQHALLEIQVMDVLSLNQVILIINNINISTNSNYQ